MACINCIDENSARSGELCTLLCWPMIIRGKAAPSRMQARTSLAQLGPMIWGMDNGRTILHARLTFSTTTSTPTLNTHISIPSATSEKLICLRTLWNFVHFSTRSAMATYAFGLIAPVLARLNSGTGLAVSSVVVFFVASFAFYLLSERPYPGIPLIGKEASEKTNFGAKARWISSARSIVFDALEKVRELRCLPFSMLTECPQDQKSFPGDRNKWPPYHIST
jgi:hypothetical protein